MHIQTDHSLLRAPHLTFVGHNHASSSVLSRIISLHAYDSTVFHQGAVTQDAHGDRVSMWFQGPHRRSTKVSPSLRQVLFLLLTLVFQAPQHPSSVLHSF